MGCVLGGREAPRTVLTPLTCPTSLAAATQAWERDEAEELRDRGAKGDIRVDQGAEGAEGLRRSRETLGKKQQVRNLGRWWLGPPEGLPRTLP